MGKFVYVPASPERRVALWRFGRQNKRPGKIGLTQFPKPQAIKLNPDRGVQCFQTLSRGIPKQSLIHGFILMPVNIPGRYGRPIKVGITRFQFFRQAGVMLPK
jgi:hypothetical protein